MCHSISIADMDCKNYTMDLFRHMDKYLSHAQICNQFGLGVPPRAKNICMFKPSADAKQTIVTFLPCMGISCFPVKPILVNFCMYHGFPLRGDSHQWVMLNPPACRRVLWMFLVHSLVCALSKNCSFARIFDKSNVNTPPPSPPPCTVVLTYLRFGSAHGCLTSLTSILVHSCTACCGCLTSLTSILVQSCTAWRGCLASLTSTLVHNCTARCSIHGAACFTCLALLLPSPSLSQDAAMPPSPIASALHETHPRPKPWRSPSLMSPSPRHTLQERLHQHTHTHTHCPAHLLPALPTCPLSHSCYTPGPDALLEPAAPMRNLTSYYLVLSSTSPLLLRLTCSLHSLALLASCSAVRLLYFTQSLSPHNGFIIHLSP